MKYSNKKCCGQAIYRKNLEDKTYVNGFISTVIGEIPRIYTHLSRKDKWENIKVRWGFNRMNYRIIPGLYGVNDPDDSSIVLVTANYKLSFDALRKELSDINAWILVVDTRGINVWCAAGKGTFGTKEIVKRLRVTKLKDLVSHNKLLVPQLGAPGVAADRVRKMTGFKVIYGPVRAEDIPEFLQNNLNASPEMRRVNFNIINRLQVIPVELKQGFSKLFWIILAFVILSGLTKSGYSLYLVGQVGLHSSINLSMAFLAGAFLAPLLLPWFPGRSFSCKGLISGLMIFGLAFSLNFTGPSIIGHIAWLMIIMAFSSFLTMNFTGASTYTSLSGVKKEMRIAIPMQISGAIAGVALWIIERFT